LIRTSATQQPPSAYLVCRHRPPQRTFTFTTPNRSQRTRDNDVRKPQKQRKTTNKNDSCEAQEKKEAFIRKKNSGAFLAFRIFAGCTNKNAGYT